MEKGKLEFGYIKKQDGSIRFDIKESPEVQEEIVQKTQASLYKRILSIIKNTLLKKH